MKLGSFDKVHSRTEYTTHLEPYFTHGLVRISRFELWMHIACVPSSIRGAVIGTGLRDDAEAWYGCQGSAEHIVLMKTSTKYGW
jgi:hypothetical protein